MDTQPNFITEEVAAPYCNSIPQDFVQVPRFSKSAGEKYKAVDIPKFKFRQRYSGYTASFWLKNFGNHSYEADNVTEGRLNHQMFSVDEAFTLWYTSPTSFRVYIHTTDNTQEYFTSQVFLPKWEWVNIQVKLDYEKGSTVMTYN